MNRGHNREPVFAEARSITSWHRKRKIAKSAGAVSCWVRIRVSRQFGVEIG